MLNSPPGIPASHIKTRDTVHILYSGLGGHGSVVFSLLEASVEITERSQLIFYGIEPLRDEYKFKCDQAGIPYVHVQSKKGNPLLAWRRLYSLLSGKKIKFIFLHSVNAILPVAVAAFLFHKKLFVIEHMANALKTRFEKLCSRMAMRYACRVIVLTGVYFNDLRILLGSKFREHKVLVIPNGIDISFFRPEHKTSDSFVYGMVSRFTSSKDHITLVKSFAELYNKFPKVVLKLAGDGETLMSVRSKVEELNLGGSVIFEGMLNEDEMLDFYHSLDVYVHISKGETMSTAIMQAMSCGLPVIASDVNGINNMVNGNVGILVQNFEQDIFSGMLIMKEKPDWRKKLGENARLFAINSFSSTAMAGKYLSLLGDKLKR